MSSKIKIILAILVVLLVTLAVIGVVYVTSRKAVSGLDGDVTPPPIKDDVTSVSNMGRFDLGEFVATSRDEELHYIKIQVEVGFIGDLEAELEERKAELRDTITNHLMKLTVVRAKEDSIDRFLHKDIERELNRVLGKNTSESRIISVFIPTFLIN